MAEHETDDIPLVALLGWIEFCCWSALVMAPIIYWLQGSSVSNDQFVVRTALIIIAAVGAVALRLYAWISERRSAAVQTPSGNLKN